VLKYLSNKHEAVPVPSYAHQHLVQTDILTLAAPVNLYSYFIVFVVFISLFSNVINLVMLICQQHIFLFGDVLFKSFVFSSPLLK
jgi:hypothetical protein